MLLFVGIHMNCKFYNLRYTKDNKVGGTYMHAGQEKFYQFMLERVQHDKAQRAKELLKESFKKQEEGTFDHHHAEKFTKEMMECLKEEHKEEVLQIIKNFDPKKNV